MRMDANGVEARKISTAATFLSLSAWLAGTTGLALVLLRTLGDELFRAILGVLGPLALLAGG